MGSGVTRLSVTVTRLLAFDSQGLIGDLYSGVAKVSGTVNFLCFDSEGLVGSGVVKNARTAKSSLAFDADQMVGFQLCFFRDFQ